MAQSIVLKKLPNDTEKILIELYEETDICHVVAVHFNKTKLFLHKNLNSNTAIKIALQYHNKIKTKRLI